MTARRMSRTSRRTCLPGLGALLVCLSLAIGSASVVGASPSPGPVAGSPAPLGSAAPSLAAEPTPAASLDPARIAAAAARLVDLAGTLEVDRLLLVELRKKLPASGAEAEEYLANVEELALKADPARLGVIVSRVRAAAPVYLDWRAQQYSTQAEATTAYLQSGAAAFDATWSTLKDAILLMVANRIDSIIDVVDEMRGGR